MLDRIGRVRAGGTSLLADAQANATILTTLRAGQALARLEDHIDDGWQLVFADIPGDGIYVGYVAEDNIAALDETALAPHPPAAAPPIAPEPVAPEPDTTESDTTESVAPEPAATTPSVADAATGAAAAAITGIAAAAAALNRTFTVDAVKSLFHPSVKKARFEAYLPLILEELVRAGLDKPEHIVIALATVKAETEGFEPISEGVSKYNTADKAHPFALYDNRTKLGNLGPPDGERFKGRGFIQLTGRDNYTRYGKRLGIDLLAQPDLANDPRIAARLLATFLADQKDIIDEAWQTQDWARARAAVNGGSHGLDRFTEVIKEAARIGLAVLVNPATLGYIAGLRIAEHFKLGEFVESPTAKAKNIDNTPPPDIIERLKVTAGHMEEIRKLLGDNVISISSGYRCPKLNQAVGGTDTSDHMSGYAVDFICKDFGSPYDICMRIKASPIMQSIDQLIHEKGRWVHVSFDPQCRQECLSFFDRNGQTVRLNGILPTDPGQ